MCAPFLMLLSGQKVGPRGGRQEDEKMEDAWISPSPSVSPFPSLSLSFPDGDIVGEHPPH